MKILYAASEVAPFAKTGGLADVGAGLPKELAKLGHEVWVIMPRHRSVDDTGIVLEKPSGRVSVHVDSIPVEGQIYETVFPGTEDTSTPARMIFVDNPAYFDRAGVYGESGMDYTDNLERFVFFCRAALQWLKKSDWIPDIIHANDWHSALIPTYLHAETSDIFDNTRTVYTIHNLAYQGLFTKSRYSVLGLPWDLFHLDALEFYDRINLSKGGIIFSNAVTTVSKKHSQEIQTVEFGCGLDGLLKSIGHRLHGILNGCDTDVWNPSTDPHIAQQFDSESFLEGKAENKKALLKEMKLDALDPDVPLFGVVSRLEALKGMDILADTAEKLVDKRAQLVILGTGDSNLEDALQDSAKNLPQNIAVRFVYSEELAHRIFAGSDFFLMPSRFEPCGLSQMYALRYGSIPIVHAVGGLADTVVDITEPNGNGFQFSEPTDTAFLKTCERAFALYAEPRKHRDIIRQAMSFDATWARAAKTYTKLYGNLLG